MPSDRCSFRHLVNRSKTQIHPHRLGIGPRACAAVAQRRAVVGEASNDGVTLHPRTRLSHQVGESRQRHELAGGEEVGEGRQAVVWRLEVPGIPRNSTSGLQPGRAWHAAASCASVVGRDRPVPRSPSATIAINRDPMRPALPSARMWSYVTGTPTSSIEMRVAYQRWSRASPLRILRFPHLY